MSDQRPIISVIDCAPIAISIENGNITDDVLKIFGKQMVAALASHGVCYFKNHGINQGDIDKYLTVSRNFFMLPDDVKERIKRPVDKNFGWIQLEAEYGSRTDGTGDFHEAFNYCPSDEHGSETWPDVQFEKQTRYMFGTFAQLCERVLDALSLGLDLPMSFMANAHKAMGTQGNQGTLRTLFYPPCTDEAVKLNQNRFGEHSDFGTISFIYQDDVGGLEASLPGTGFVPVTPIPGTLVVLACDLLQRWTSDALKSTLHRVVIPTSDKQRKTSRQSLVFFSLPDDDVVVKPLDGSDKYEPVRSLEFQSQRYRQIGLNLNPLGAGANK